MERRINKRCATLVVAALMGLLGVGESLAHPELDRQISDLDQRLDLEGPNAELYIRRAELHRVHREWNAALADLARARETAPEMALIDYFSARVHLERGKLKPARKQIDRFLDRQPQHSAALAIRARISMQRARTAEAVKYYNKAINASEHARPDPGLYLERARAQEALGPDAIPAAIRGLDEGSAALGHPITLAQYAIELELERGNHKAAIDRIDQLASSAARQEGWHLKRAEIYEDVGRIDDARREYDAALTALERLPATRRGSRAMQRLEQTARSGLERLITASPTQTR